MRSVERLEKFWRNLVLTIPLAKEIDGAVVACYPEVSIYPVNHAANINVNASETENLLNKVTEYFSSRGSSYSCFRTSPITRPKGFNQFLEDNGFERKLEESVMVFKGKQVEEKLNPKIKVKEISEGEKTFGARFLLEVLAFQTSGKKGLTNLFVGM